MSEDPWWSIMRYRATRHGDVECAAGTLDVLHAQIKDRIRRASTCGLRISVLDFTISDSWEDS